VIVARVKYTVQFLEKYGWRPKNPVNRGSFGDIVHKLTGDHFKDKPGWLVDAYVGRDTNILLSIGSKPANLPESAFQQVDIIKLRDGFTPQVGQTLQVDDIVDLYDIKTSLSGNIGPAQAARLKKILNGGDVSGQKSVKSLMTPRRWTPERGWHDNIRYHNGIKLFGLFIGAEIWAALHIEDYREEFDKIIIEARLINGETPPKRPEAIAAWLETHVKPYFQHFVADDFATNIPFKVIQSHVLSKLRYQ
jgi:hypothetical protein